MQRPDLIARLDAVVAELSHVGEGWAPAPELYVLAGRLAEAVDQWAEAAEAEEDAHLLDDSEPLTRASAVATVAAVRLRHWSKTGNARLVPSLLLTMRALRAVLADGSLAAAAEG